MFIQKLKQKNTCHNTGEVFEGVGIIHDVGNNNCSYKLQTNIASYEVTDKIDKKLDRYFILPVTSIKTVCKNMGVKYE